MAKRELWSFANPYRLEVVAEITGETMTRQEFADECDINQIMARYEKAGGTFPLPPNGSEPVYYDFVGMPDLRQSIDAMIEADEAFMRLPAQVRKEFDNDAVRFVEFAQNRDNLDKLREWGLAEPVPVASAPIQVRVVPEPGAPPIAPASSSPPVKAGG